MPAHNLPTVCAVSMASQFDHRPTTLTGVLFIQCTLGPSCVLFPLSTGYRSKDNKQRPSLQLDVVMPCLAFDPFNSVKFFIRVQYFLDLEFFASLTTRHYFAFAAFQLVKISTLVSERAPSQALVCLRLHSSLPSILCSMRVCLSTLNFFKVDTRTTALRALTISSTRVVPPAAPIFAFDPLFNSEFFQSRHIFRAWNFFGL